MTYSTIKYYVGSELPDLVLAWYDYKKNLLDFSVGYSFEVKVGKLGETALITKTAGITGAASDPNVLIGWVPADGLSSLTAGEYTLQVTATRNTDMKRRRMTRVLEILETVR